MKSKFLTILLLMLVCVVLPTQKASGTYTLPPPSNTRMYVDNLISSYNALVPSNAPNFDGIKGYYALYHAIGNTFKVLVMRSDNTTQVVVLNFVPIGGNDPIVVMDDNDTFVGAYKLFDFQAGNDSIEGITFSYQNTNIPITLAYSVDWADITGAYMVNSKNAADNLFRADSRKIPLQVTPNQSFLEQVSTCIFAGICGIAGFMVGVISGVWFLREKLHITKAPDGRSKKRKKPSKELRQITNKSIVCLSRLSILCIIAFSLWEPPFNYPNLSFPH